MKSAELRQKFLEFFEKRGHKIVPSASLIPQDTTTLFNSAGMQPLVPYLLGEKHPAGKRIVDIQKCFRTVDIDEVGDDTHNTFFEMLGNWSLGDYWKEDSIRWSFEFLTDKNELNIPIQRLAVSCFGGDENAPKDEESAKIWENIGISKERIIFLPKEDNWWGPVGESGPCGPDTEIFYWKNNNVPVPQKFDPTDKNWVEIWNNVFMQYVKTADGEYMTAEQKNVDTGMGFERTLAVLNGYENIYETDVLQPLISKISEYTNSEDFRGKRIVADHIRATTFMISDGIEFSNTDRGYVMRRILRKAAYYCNSMNLEKIGLADLVEIVIKIYEGVYPLDGNKVCQSVKKEVSLFSKTLATGKKKYEEGEDAFILFTTYGFPPELIKELDKENGKERDWVLFEQKMKEHQELSRTASAGMFKGGLADHEPATVKLHTAHHLLLAALQELFGKQVKQRGSNINQERLRIDFSFDRKITPEEIKKLEDIVNDKIGQGLDVVRREMPIGEAQKIGAEMEFGVKYGNTVSVYFIEDKKGNTVSKEFCGGPHVANTKELGKFKIVKEEASSQGVRRIKAILQ